MPRTKKSRLFEEEPEIKEDSSQTSSITPEEELEKLMQEGLKEINKEEKEEKETEEEKTGEKKEEKEKMKVAKEEKEEKEEEEPQEKTQEKEEVKTEKKGEEKEEQEKSSEEEKKLLADLGLTKFKSLKDALEAYKNLESAYGKTQSLLASYQKGFIPQEIKEGLEGIINIAQRPRVEIKLPDAQSYVNDDGTFDISSYLKDALTDFTLSLQKSLLFGQLGSAIYSLQKMALTDTYSKAKSQAEIDRQAEEINNQLLEQFPVLKNNENLVKKVERALVGERQLKGEPLTKEEIFAIVKDVIEEIKVEQKDQEEKTETIKGFGNLSEDKEPRTKTKEEEVAEQLIEASLNRKSFF